MHLKLVIKQNLILGLLLYFRRVFCIKSSPLGRVSAHLSCLKKRRETNTEKGFTPPKHKVLSILGRGSGELLHPLQPGEQSHHGLSFHRATSVIPPAGGFGWGLIFLISLNPDSKGGDQSGLSGSNVSTGDSKLGILSGSYLLPKKSSWAGMESSKFLFLTASFQAKSCRAHSGRFLGAARRILG